MLLSVIIPVYNVADYLEACVASVLCCEFRDLEVVLVDDGSTDGKSGALCDRLAEKAPEMVRVIHQKNRGLGGARNTGLQYAAGEYVLFVDSDDTLAAGAIDRLCTAVADVPVDILEFAYSKVAESGETLDTCVPPYPEGTLLEIHDKHLLPLHNHTVCNKLWRRSLIAESGVRFPEQQWYEDLTFCWKIWQSAQTYKALHDSLYLYLQRQGSIMNNRNIERNAEIFAAVGEILEYYRMKDSYDSFRPELDAMIAGQMYYACYRVLMIDPKHELIGSFLRYLKKEAPAYRKSRRYREVMGRNQRIILFLLQLGCRHLPARLLGYRKGGV